MSERDRLKAERQHNDEIRASMPPGSMLSGPSVKVFFEGWAKVGFNAGRMGHYWRRRPEDRVLSLCGIWHQLQYTFRGQLMIFEVGNFPKCRKCGAKRSRSDARRVDP